MDAAGGGSVSPRRAAPRKAAATKALVVLRDGGVHSAGPETVVVVGPGEAAGPDYASSAASFVHSGSGTSKPTGSPQPLRYDTSCTGRRGATSQRPSG